MREQKQKEIRRRLDAELSDIHWTGLNSRAVKNAVENGGKIMKKKISTAFALVVALMLATIGALAAAGVLFSEKVDVAKQADKALESAYGITPAMQAYFTRSVEEENGKTVVRYTSYDVFSYVLGDYTVAADGKDATVTWSWDGTPIADGFDAAPWGEVQLAEMVAEVQKNNDYSRYYAKASELAQAAGTLGDKTAIPTEAELEVMAAALAKTKADVEARMKLSAETLVQGARDALVSAYQLKQDMMPFLGYIEGNESYLISADGKACMALCFGFGLNEADETYATDAHPEWESLCGVYAVTIDVETGVVEDIFFDSGLAGNG